MSMRNRTGLGLFGMFAAMAAAGHTDLRSREGYNELTDEERKELKRIRERKINENRGLTEFKYGENSVWALNKKNADRKAKKRGYV